MENKTKQSNEPGQKKETMSSPEPKPFGLKNRQEDDSTEIANELFDMWINSKKSNK